MSLLWWAVVFFVVSIIAGFFGFTGVATGASAVARILFFVFIAIFIVLLILALVGVGAGTAAAP